VLENGILAGVLSTLPSSIEGLKKFPEPNYLFHPPGPFDQRGVFIFFNECYNSCLANTALFFKTPVPVWTLLQTTAIFLATAL
jgi:hypothetical protein